MRSPVNERSSKVPSIILWREEGRKRLIQEEREGEGEGEGERKREEIGVDDGD